jgi:hypothetical protein
MSANPVRLASALVSALLLASCADSPTAPRPFASTAAPRAVIGDASHGAGATHFYFLPPTAIPSSFGALSFAGAFDPAVNASARVCAGTGDCPSATAIASFSAGGGTGGSPLAKVRVNALFQSYSAVWDTRTCSTGPCALSSSSTYRLHVYATNSAGSELELGFADIAVVGSVAQLGGVDTRSYSPLIKGMPYVIAFRIERGVVGSVTVAPPSAALAVGASQAFTASAADLHGTPVACTATWASSNTATATVSSAGTVTGVAAGVATISAMCGGQTGTGTVSVIAPQWRIVPGTPTGNPGQLSVWGSATGRVYASGPNDGVMTLFDGSSWSTIPSSVPNGTGSLFGFSDNDVYATGGNFAGLAYVLHYDGSQWAAMLGVPQDQVVTAVWGTSPTSLWATRIDGSVIHYDGSSWTFSGLPTPARLESIFGTSATDIYAVGYNFPSATAGYVYHFDGSSWQLVLTTSLALSRVWASGASDVWAVGDAGLVLHYDGTAWSQVATPTTAVLRGVWGTSSSDVMAVGERGTILHYDGSAWSQMTSPTTFDLWGVWGNGAANYYAVGLNQGVVVRYAP